MEFWLGVFRYYGWISIPEKGKSKIKPQERVIVCVFKESGKVWNIETSKKCPLLGRNNWELTFEEKFKGESEKKELISDLPLLGIVDC